MKKLLLFLPLFVLASCSSEEVDPEDFDLTLVPIEEVDMADTFIHGERYIIKVTYSKPTHCHTYSTTNYENNDNEYTFAVVNSYNPEDNNCVEEEDLTDITSFTFDADRNDFYIFKFWQGEDENKNPIYLTKEIPVTGT